jgi:hypothetical protein
MLPAQLTSSSFDKYPAQANKIAIDRLQLLRTLPLTLVASLLREVSVFDWLFPTEQRSLLAQMDGLPMLPANRRAGIIAEFGQISVPDSLASMDWINEPKRFLESLTAWLWSSNQIDQFHKAARDFGNAISENSTPQIPSPRAAVVVLPAGIDKPGYPLFRKLRAHGTWFENVSSDANLNDLAAWVSARGARHPQPLSHFYIDGGIPVAALGAFAESLSWDQTAAIRAQVLKQVTAMTEAPGTGPEKARSFLANSSPAAFGLHAEGAQGVMERFALSVLAEGAGTQIFSTTFAQWGARELLRRAEPDTLVVRFGLRRHLQTMNEMLGGDAAPDDAPGSCVDADMGAYYTWVNQQRLSGSSSAGFLAISQTRRQAIAIGPTVAKGAVSPQPAELDGLLKMISA